MTQSQKFSLFLLRIATGWFMFYAGITKVIDPAWSAAGYLAGAKHVVGFYQWLAGPGILPFVNFINEWGLTLLGVSLIFGIGVRLSATLGIVLMALYYLALAFPYPDAHSLIVDDHIIYACALLVLASMRAGRAWGLERWCASLPICSRFPVLRNMLG